MSFQDTSHPYIPIQPSTPTQTPESTPISTPTKARILRPNFLTRGSPIKFDLSTPEKAKLRDVEFDFEHEKSEKDQALDIRKVVFQVVLGISWAVLAGVAVYLYAAFGLSFGNCLGRFSISQLRRWGSHAGVMRSRQSILWEWRFQPSVSDFRLDISFSSLLVSLLLHGTEV